MFFIENECKTDILFLSKVFSMIKGTWGFFVLTWRLVFMFYAECNYLPAKYNGNEDELFWE